MTKVIVNSEIAVNCDWPEVEAEEIEPTFEEEVYRIAQDAAINPSTLNSIPTDYKYTQLIADVLDGLGLQFDSDPTLADDDALAKSRLIWSTEKEDIRKAKEYVKTKGF